MFRPPLRTRAFSGPEGNDNVPLPQRLKSGSLARWNLFSRACVTIEAGDRHARNRVRNIDQRPREICFDLARDIDLHVKSTPGTDERAVGGVTSGLIGLGEEVTWEATRFGFRQRLTSRITAFDRPHHFRDSLVSGAFKRFDHDHFFLLDDRSTIMRDVFDYDSPLGWLGRRADALFLRSYMVNLLTQRARVIKMPAEAAFANADGDDLR